MKYAINDGEYQDSMKKIIPISDLQRRAGQVVGDLAATGESVIITHHGRPAAVLVAADQYIRIEEDLARLDELELLEMVSQARGAIGHGQSVSHQEVKARLARTRLAERKRRTR